MVSMSPKTAARLAIAALKAQRQRFAFEAQLRWRGLVTPETEQAAREYKRLTEAMTMIEKWGQVAA